MTKFSNIQAITVLSALIGSTALTPAAKAGEPISRTVLGVDISGSSTVLVDQNSADQTADYVRKYIIGLTPPHRLRLLSAGNEGLGPRAIDVRGQITERRATSPKKVAAKFAGYFQAMPRYVREGIITPQNTTSLVAFFQSLEPICAQAPTKVIVFTDGVEWSSTVDGRAFLKGKIGLPDPSSAFLANCHVEMLGIGQLKTGLNSDGLEARLKPIWKQWLSDAGASSVRVAGALFGF